MENQVNTENNNSLYYILSTIFMALTCWVLYETISSLIVGALLGLLLAAFFVNALVKNRDEA